MYRINKRTFQDLYSQIENEEQLKEEKKREDDAQEVYTSDCQENAIEAGLGSPSKKNENAYNSDDEQNDALMQKIHGQILGVLKCETNSFSNSDSKNIPKPQNFQNKDKEKKKPSKSQNQNQHNVVKKG